MADATQSVATTSTTESAAEIADLDALPRNRWPTVAFVEAVNAGLPYQHPRLSVEEIEPWWWYGLTADEALVAAYFMRRFAGRSKPSSVDASEG